MDVIPKTNLIAVTIFSPILPISMNLISEREREGGRKRTAAVTDGGGGDVAGGGEGHGLGDVERDPQLSAVPEGLAQALGVGFEHRFEPRAARPLRLRRRAPRHHERQAVRHRQHQARAVRRRRRSRTRRRARRRYQRENRADHRHSRPHRRHYDWLVALLSFRERERFEWEGILRGSDIYKGGESGMRGDTWILNLGVFKETLIYFTKF